MLDAYPYCGCEFGTTGPGGPGGLPWFPSSVVYDAVKSSWETPVNWLIVLQVSGPVSDEEPMGMQSETVASEHDKRMLADAEKYCIIEEVLENDCDLLRRGLMWTPACSRMERDVYV